MKILNVNITLDPVAGGGTAERTYQMSRSLARAGVDCSLLTLDTGLTDQRRAELAQTELVALPCLNRRFNILRSGIRQIERLVAAADVIHLMGHWNLLNVLVHSAARRLNKPYVICPAGELAIFGRSRRLKSLFNLTVGRRVVRDAAGWIAITQRETSQFADYGVDPAAVEVIPNGINPDDFHEGCPAAFRERFGLTGKPLILFLGRLNAIKGADLLLKAFASVRNDFPGYHLALVGPDGGMAGELNEIVDACGMRDRVHFLGYLTGSEKSAAYRAADLLVIPSRQEAMSIVVLEAGIVGTPVLLTDQCGFDEVAAIGGGRVAAATVEGLRAGLAQMLCDGGELKRSGQRLLRHVREKFLWESIVDRYIELYRQLLEGSSSYELQYTGHRCVGVCR